jgi:hypothetical protein
VESSAAAPGTKAQFRLAEGAGAGALICVVGQSVLGRPRWYALTCVAPPAGRSPDRRRRGLPRAAIHLAVRCILVMTMGLSSGGVEDYWKTPAALKLAGRGAKVRAVGTLLCPPSLRLPRNSSTSLAFSLVSRAICASRGSAAQAIALLASRIGTPRARSSW